MGANTYGEILSSIHRRLQTSACKLVRAAAAVLYGKLTIKAASVGSSNGIFQEIALCERGVGFRDLDLRRVRVSRQATRERSSEQKSVEQKERAGRRT